jgi:hypothetical protein
LSSRLGIKLEGGIDVLIRKKLISVALILLFVLTLGCRQKDYTDYITSPNQDTIKDSKDVDQVQKLIKEYKVNLYNIPDYKKAFEGWEFGSAEEITKSRIKFNEQFKPFFTKEGFEKISTERGLVSHRFATQEGKRNLTFWDLNFLKTEENKIGRMIVNYEAKFKEIDPSNNSGLIVTEKGSVELNKEEGVWKIAVDSVLATNVEGETELTESNKLFVGNGKQQLEIKDPKKKAEITKHVNNMFTNRSYEKRFGLYGAAVPNGDIGSNKIHSWVELVYDKPIKVNFYKSDLLETYKLFVVFGNGQSALFIAPKKDGKYATGAAPLVDDLELATKIDTLLGKT